MRPVGIIQGSAIKAPKKEERLFPHPLDNATHKGLKGPRRGKRGLNHMVDEQEDACREHHQSAKHTVPGPAAQSPDQ